jgi:hypothetical protein
MRFGGVPSNYVSATQRFFDSPKNEVKNKTAKSEAFRIYCKIIFRCFYKFFFHSTQTKRETRKCAILETIWLTKKKKWWNYFTIYCTYVYLSIGTTSYILYCDNEQYALKFEIVDRKWLGT